MESKHCWYRFKFTNEISNIAFRNVHGMSFRNDTTFITTMRALVIPRMESTDDLKYSSMDFSQNECNSAGVRKYLIELMMRCLRNIKMANNVVYMCLGARNNLNEEQLSNYDLTMHDIESTLKKVLLGYTRESKLEEELRRVEVPKIGTVRLNTQVWINPQRRSTMIVSENGTYGAHHILESHIQKLLPWYFQGATLNQQEEQLLQSLLLFDGKQQYTSVEKAIWKSMQTGG